MVASLAWGGHSNGYIPNSAMTDIGRGFVLELGAAKQFAAARAECLALYGIDMLHDVDETYRSFQGQVDAKAYWTARGKPGNAAAPGYSIHGWGKAIDFNVDGMPSTDYYNKVMSVLEKYGFIRDVDGESWHVSFREGQVTSWASGNIISISPEEDDMTPEQAKKLDELAWTVNQMKGSLDALMGAGAGNEGGKGPVHEKLDKLLWVGADGQNGLRSMVQNVLNKLK